MKSARTRPSLRGYLRPAYAVLIACGALLAAGWAITLERIDYEYDSALENAVRQNDNLALAYEQHTIRTLEAVDQAVRFVRYEYLEEGHELQLDKVFAQTWLASSLFLYAAVLDENGMVIRSSRHNARPFDASDRGFFQLHRADPADRLHIGAPTESRVDGRAAVHATRRSSGPGGEFRGVALVAIAPEQLADFQHLIELGRQGVVQLVGLDGIARVRRHGSFTSFGDDMRDSQLLKLALQVPYGKFVTRGRQDGVTRLQSYRRLERFPFVVGLGTSTGEALVGHQRQARILYAGATGATLLVLLLGVGLALYYRRRGLAAEALRESEARFRSLTELSSDFYWETDAEHRLVRRGSGGKRSSVELFERGGQLGKRRWELAYVSPDEAGWQAHRAALDAHAPFRGFEISRPGEGGAERFISLSGDPVFDAGGTFTGYRGVGTDITARKAAESALLRKSARLANQQRALAELAQGDLLGGIAPHDTVGRLIEVAAATLGVQRVSYWKLQEDRSAIECADLFELARQRHSAGIRLAAADYPRYFAALGRHETIAAADAHTDPRTAEFSAGYLAPLGIGAMLDVPVFVKGQPAGVLCHEHVGGAREWQPDEQLFAAAIAGMVALAVERAERRQAEAERAAIAQRNGALVEALGEVVYEWFPAEDRLVWEGDYTRVLGYAPGEMGAKTAAWLERVHPDDLASVKSEVEQAERERRNYRLEYRFRHRDGSYRWMHDSGVVYFAAAGGIERIIGVFSDITERKRAEEKLAHQAHYDALTELPNRTLFYDRLAQTLNQARRHAWNVGVLFLDVDRFKNVNDTLGHGAGDALLQAIAKRLAVCVRTGDTVARIGGDEFAVIAADLAQGQDAGLVAAKMVEALAQPFVIEGQEVFVSGSIGIAAYPLDGQDGVALMKNADAAMSRAKELGRNNYQFYTAAMNERAMENLLLQNDLRRALERGEFRLHFQPKASLKSGCVTGFEALLRWERPGHGLVPPGKFIPLLEETGLIVPVGEWVIRAACAQIHDWRRQGLEPLPVAVNLAAKQFLHRDIAAVVETALCDHGVPPQFLEIEITESDAMQEPEQVMRTLLALRARGVSIAIDDFGTGYSSLSYLKRFPVETLKLDRSFVNGLPGDADDVSIARAVITMAHSLGLKVVAEGVEKPEQREFLAHNGCDMMQGYLLARPMPAHECERLLAPLRRRAEAAA